MATRITDWKMDLERNISGPKLFIRPVIVAWLTLLHCSAIAEPGLTELSNPAMRAKEMALVKEIHKKIVANTEDTSETAMKKYRVDLPPLGKAYPRVPTKAFFMLPIKGGTFKMGNPEGKGDPQESPTHTVTLDPFWMQQCEVSWNEYQFFMYPVHPKPKVADIADAVALPSHPLTEMAFGMQRDGLPAIGMSQHSANKYCQWLSARTGQFYRLPTEAEWEYACRAGTETAYSFGDDPAELDKYGWFKDNSNEMPQIVGKKLPNPWGLHDMHGNVSEWTLDQFVVYENAPARNPWIKATATYPHVLRGGSWEDSAKWCRSAARQRSDPKWNQDPIRQKVVWSLEKPTIGFRVVRPLKVPTAEEMFRYWNNEVEIDPN